jgi:hypothetical protein
MAAIVAELREEKTWKECSLGPLARKQYTSFTFIAPHSRARGADDRGRRRRDASYGVARDNHPVSTIR